MNPDRNQAGYGTVLCAKSACKGCVHNERLQSTGVQLANVFLKSSCMCASTKTLAKTALAINIHTAQG